MLEDCGKMIIFSDMLQCKCILLIPSTKNYPFLQILTDESILRSTILYTLTKNQFTYLGPGYLSHPTSDFPEIGPQLNLPEGSKGPHEDPEAWKQGSILAYDSPSSYAIYASGRAGIKRLTSRLSMVARHDMFTALLHAYQGRQEFDKMVRNRLVLTTNSKLNNCKDVVLTWCFLFVCLQNFASSLLTFSLYFVDRRS